MANETEDRCKAATFLIQGFVSVSKHTGVENWITLEEDLEFEEAWNKVPFWCGVPDARYTRVAIVNQRTGRIAFITPNIEDL